MNHNDFYPMQSAAGAGRGKGSRGHGADAQLTQRHQHDQRIFHALLEHHGEVQREVENLPDGIRSVTTSRSPQLAALIQEHAHAMHRRLEEGFGLRFWDPAFAELFAQTEKVSMRLRDLPDGVETVETSADPNVVKLIQAHGQVVNAFVSEGFAAAQRQSPLPNDYRRILPTPPSA